MIENKTLNVLNLQDLIKITGWSKQHIYKLTSKAMLPYYKPFNKTIFFKRQEIENWLLQNRQVPMSEIEGDAKDYLMTKRMKHNEK